MIQHHWTDVVAHARTYIGTPYKHEAREPGHFLDCVGVIVCCAHHFGVSTADLPHYSRWATDDLLERQCDASFIRQPEDSPLLPGMAVLFQIGRAHQHACVTGDHPFEGEVSMIHAHMPRGRTLENIIDPKWRKRIIATYKYPGVDYDG